MLNPLSKTVLLAGIVSVLSPSLGVYAIPTPAPAPQTPDLANLANTFKQISANGMSVCRRSYDLARRDLHETQILRARGRGGGRGGGGHGGGGHGHGGGGHRGGGSNIHNNSVTNAHNTSG